MMRCGKDIFVQLSMTCNDAGIEWLRRELEPHGLRVHRVRFPYDLAPSHLDCTFVPLRPEVLPEERERGEQWKGFAGEIRHEVQKVA